MSTDESKTAKQLSKQQELGEKANQLLAQRRMLEALKTYDEAIRIDPKHEDAYASHSNMSAVCFMIGKYKEALKSADSCIAIDTKKPSGHLRRANVLEKLGRVEEALEEYKKEIEISPNLPDAQNGKLRCTTVLNQRALSKMSDEEKAKKHVEALEGLKKGFANTKDEKVRKQKAVQFMLHGCAEKDLEEVKIAIEVGGAEINPPPPPFPAQFTPLLIAVDRQAEDIVRYLLENKAEVDRSVDANRTPLITAALIGNAEICKALVEFEADIEAATADDNKSRPLHLAARSGHDEVVQFLVDIGAEVSSRDGLNATALAWAVLYGHTECVRILLEAGASPLKDGVDSKDTCLMVAASSDKTGEITKLLLDKFVGEDEEIYRAIKAAAENENIPSFGALLESYVDLTRDGKHLPLIKAIRLLSYTIDKENKCHVELTKAVLAKCKDVTRVIMTPAAKIATSAIQVATMQGSLDLIKLFVEDTKGFDINARERDQIQLGQGYTALHLAFRYKQTEIIKYLLKEKKDLVKVNIAGFDGLMPIHLAAANGNIPSMRLLVDNGAKIDAVVNDDAKKQAAKEAAAKENGDDDDDEEESTADEKDKQKDSKQQEQQKSSEKLSLAVAEGATPLIFAAIGGQLNMCVELIQLGARIDCQVQGATPLEIVCGFQNLVSNTNNGNNNTSSDDASLNAHAAALQANSSKKDAGHYEVVKALLNASESGKTGQYSSEVLKNAYEAAVENKHRSLADLIKKRM